MGICLIVKSGGGVDPSSATATADKILSGYTVYVNDNKITGTIGIVGNQNRVDTKWGTADSDYYKTWCGVTNWIWEGWHDGTSGFNVGTIAEHTWDCDIPNQWWCLTGYSYWANGTKYDGAMAVRGKKTWTLGANGSQIVEEGWHDGNGTVTQSISIDAGEWGPTPTTTNQQLCWPGWYYSKNRWCWGNANLTSGNIKSGVSIFGVNGRYVETKRYIIQNGALCSGVSIPYYHWSEQQDGEDGDSYWSLKTVSPGYYNVTINGLTYIRLCQYEDHGSWDENENMIIRGGIGSIVSLSSNDANGRLPGAICGDFACKYVSTPRLSLYTVVHAGASKSDRIKTAAWYLTPSGTKNSTSSWTTFTYTQTGVSVSIQNGFGMYSWTSLLQYGDFMVGCGSGYAPSLACHNLWIDTSKSI